MHKIKQEGSRCSWSREETKELLAIMKEKKLMEQLDGKTRRNNNVYVLISNELAKKGFKKSSEKVKLKFRTLKAEFFKVRRANNKSGAGRTSMSHFDDLNDLLGDRPVATAMGIDTTVLEESGDHLLMHMEEEYLDDFEEENEVLVSVEPQGTQKVKKKRNAIQMTLLEIAADVKESNQAVLNTITEENQQFIAEERRLHQQYMDETKVIMEEDRKATREMLLEIFSKQ